MQFFQLHRNIQIRIVTSGMTKIAGTMVMPFMAIYFSDYLGTALTGILMTLTVIVGLVAGLYGGYIADRIGRKRVLVSSQVVLAVAFSVIALANSPWLTSPWLTFAMMLVQAGASGLLNPAAEAMLVDVSTKETRRLMYAISYWSINLSIAIGALLGGQLYAGHRFELFLTLDGVNVVSLLLCAFCMTESLTARAPATRRNILGELVRTYAAVLKDRRFVLLFLAGLCMMTLEFQTMNYVGVRLAGEFGTQTLSFFGLHLEATGIKMVSWLQVTNTVTVVAAAGLLGRLTKRFSDSSLLLTGTVIYTVGYATVGWANALPLLLLAMLVATVGELLYVPVRQAILADLVPDNARSSYMAVHGWVFQGAKMAGTLGISLGAVLPSWGMSTLYACIGLTALLVFRLVVAPKPAPAEAAVLAD